MKKTNFLCKVAVFFAVMILFTAVQQARAATTYTVDTTADDPNLNACTSAPSDCSLRGAVNKVNTNSGALYIIRFALPSDDAGCTAEGVCTITLTNGMLSIIQGNASETVDIINSTGPGKLIISGGDRSPVFYNAKSTLTVDGITIANGRGATLTAYGYAGGFTTEADAGLILKNCVVVNSSGRAGGISAGGSVAISDSAIINNSGEYGGGVTVYGVLSISRSTISGNTVSYGYGNGGGIAILGGRASIGNSTISGNTAFRGAGIYMSRTNPSATSQSLSLYNSTITDNNGTSSYNTSAGIYTVYTDAGYEGQKTPVFLFSTIVAGNYIPVVNSATAPDIYAEMSANSAYNLIGNGTGLKDFSGQSNNQIGTLENPIDALLGALADNGGSTRTHALLSGSPAIDKGKKFNANVTTDQRGLLRTIDLAFILNAADGTDIGAYEVQGASCPAITVSPSALPDGLLGTFYNQTVSASGGSGSYAFSVINGSLPSGLSLISSSGVISGTPDTKKTYGFTVLAEDSNGCSSAQPFTVTINEPVIFNPPSNLRADSVGKNFVNLRWTDNSNSESGFIVEVCSSTTTCRDTIQIAQTRANVTTFSVTGLQPNTYYYFRVAAINRDGQRTRYSNILTVKTLIR